ncbi:hypothetical protein COOONC_22420 [Cooperia oncophora]
MEIVEETHEEKLIVHPQQQKLDNYYDNFSVEETDSLQSDGGETVTMEIEYDLKRLSKPVDRTEYDFNAAVVNAYYDSRSNSISKQINVVNAQLY